MTTLNILMLTLLTSLLSACVLQTKTGGPCTYVSSTEQASVLQLKTSYALLKSSTNQYEVELTLFNSTPQIGDSYRLALSTITQGSCTPIVIQSVKLNATH
ncbi:hypothetical protein RS130_23240 [Paraglaciecola aquimarina]|uniref:Lipoprotein n=1 Tax=Paraglaciecola aquimarina TaxID=1235557 RepID=A0ABU3T2D4_9ALTE|nr:hypothetical protein [Paraglaciecola aquimarina]MDU0356422.1 hypothetical protein [Paraglaciecola aquimarina]